jgi:hypothetical protein
MTIVHEYTYHNVNGYYFDHYNSDLDKYMRKCQRLNQLAEAPLFNRTLTYDKDIAGSEWDVVDVGNLRQSMSLVDMQERVGTAPVGAMINVDDESVYGRWENNQERTPIGERLTHPELRHSGLDPYHTLQSPTDYHFRVYKGKSGDRWNTGQCSCKSAIGSFDYTIDKLPVTKTLYDMLTKLKKSHPHIQARLAYDTKRMGWLHAIDAFTEWAMERRKVDPMAQDATLDRWLEKEVQHTECGSRGFVTGMRLTTVMLHDTKTNVNYGILQHLPSYRAGQVWAKVAYYSPRIMREKSEYEHGEYRVQRGDCFISSANPSRLLTQVKKTFTPLSLMEKFWLSEKRLKLIKNGVQALTQEKSKQASLIRDFYHKISVEDAFKQFVNMYVNNTALQPTDLPPQAVNAIEAYLEAKRQNDENVELQDGLAPLTLFTVPDSDRVYFTPWDGEGFGHSSRGNSRYSAPNFMYVNSVDRLPPEVHSQLAVMDMARKTRNDKRNAWDSSPHLIPCVGAYTNLEDTYIHPDKGLWIKLIVMVYVPEDVIRDLSSNADGNVHVE